MDTVEVEVRLALAEVLDLDQLTVMELPDGTPLFGEPLGLGSLAGARLLTLIRERSGVDVAALDWALESLSTIATLTDFVRRN
jgi:acyl carrier protein